VIPDRDKAQQSSLKALHAISLPSFVGWPILPRLLLICNLQLSTDSLV